MQLEYKPGLFDLMAHEVYVCTMHTYGAGK